MLTEKLNLSDLQSTQVRNFDATAAYAQQKRQQVIMTEMYAQKYPDIKFSSMHPGWADTPGEIFKHYFDSSVIYPVMKLNDINVKTAWPVWVVFPLESFEDFQAFLAITLQKYLSNLLLQLGHSSAKSFTQVLYSTIIAVLIRE